MATICVFVMMMATIYVFVILIMAVDDMCVATVADKDDAVAMKMAVWWRYAVSQPACSRAVYERLVY